jgi:hypothetical protein
MTGGQYDVQEPVQFDWVGVSIANQYKVSPAALTSTSPLLVLIVLTATEATPALAAAGLDVDEPVGPPLFPQAARTAAAAARLGTTHQRLRMTLSPLCDQERRQSLLRKSSHDSLTTSALTHVAGTHRDLG